MYAVNLEEARGGVTAYRTVLEEEDLATARRGLEQELLQTARQLIQEELQLQRIKNDSEILALLEHAELTKTTFTGFVLPWDFLGEPIISVPVEGEVIYTVLAYDKQAILDMLSDELESHVREGRRLLSETLSLDRLVVHVIDYEDDFSWVKLTVDLTGSEQFILDPLSPAGAQFARKVREQIMGLSKGEALKIVRNMPEVQNAKVNVWPPWNTTLPTIPVHIAVVTE